MGEFSNFVFYGNWMNTIEGHREDFGDEYADEMLINIIYYGTTGKILSNKKSIIGFIEGSVAPNINSAKSRYEKACAGGEKGGRQKLIGKEENIQIALLKLQGKSQKETAAILGVSDSTIKRSEGWKNPEEFRLKAELGQNLGQNLGQSSVQDPGQVKNQVSSVQQEDKDIDKDIDNEKEIDIDTGLSISRLNDLAAQCNRDINWVKIGVGLKERSEWEKYGFGLFFKEDFIKQVDIKYKEQLRQEEEIKHNEELIRRQIENRKVVKINGNGEVVGKKKEINFDSLIN